MLTMTRRVTFSAALADWISTLDADENRAVFGPAASPEPYGHNYSLDVTVSGSVNPTIGIIVNIKEIDRIVREHVVAAIDRGMLNNRLTELRGKPITPENLLLALRDRLLPYLPAETELVKLRIKETPLSGADWTKTYEDQDTEGGTMQMTRVYEFAASHRLHSPHLTDLENRDLFGKCNQEFGHGHNYIVEVTVKGPIDSRTGRIMDAGLLDDLVNHEVIDRYDHKHFDHDIPEFAGAVPSTELLTKTIWMRLRDKINGPARLSSIIVRETARNIFEYRGEDDDEQ